MKNIIIHYIFSFIIISFLSSCNGKSDKRINSAEPNIEKENISDRNDAITKSQDDNISAVKNTQKLLELPINVQKIKSQLDGVTTTFLSEESSSIFPDKGKNKFYASYTLIKNDEGGTPTKRIGNLVIYDSINPYLYEKKTEEFIEITLNSSGINLYDNKLKVGISTSNLIQELGNDFEKSNDTYIYKSKNKIGFFKIKNDLVTKLKIGLYGNNTQIDNILNSENW